MPLYSITTLMYQKVLVMSCDIFSPHSHLTVHHTREVELSQQILHLVVFLAVLLYISMVTRDVRA